jgi:hypothetical protein
MAMTQYLATLQMVPAAPSSSYYSDLGVAGDWLAERIGLRCGAPSPLLVALWSKYHMEWDMKNKLVFSSLALGTLAVAVGAIAGATLSHPIAARAAEPMRLAEAEMDGMTAGASLSMTTGASVTGSDSATVQARQNQNGGALWGGGAEITGTGLVFGTANGSPTSGRAISSADASGDIHPTGTVGGVVNVPDKTVVYGATWGVAIDLPLLAK